MAAMQIRLEQVSLLLTEWITAGARSRNSGAPTPPQNSVPPGLKIDVRQGIA
jgi:hypothetical protein